MGESKDCFCGACNCGRHKLLCKPVRVSDAVLEAQTEYGDNYQKFKMEVRRGRPAPQELSVGGEFYGQTESRDKFITHPTPPRPKARKELYVPNDTKLEAETTQRHDFQQWPTSAPPKKYKDNQKWVSTSGSFDGATTTKTDYVTFPLPPHYVRPVQKYVKSEAKFEGLSTQADDYQRWEVTSIPVRRKKAVAPTIASEDRDFQSTTTSSYVQHHVKRELVKAPQNRTTDSASKFEGISTNKEAFQTWQLPPRYQRRKAEYAPSAASFDGLTTYKDTFQPKSAERYVHPIPTYTPNDAKFEGMSTHKTDFLPTGKITRIKDFRPRNEYVNVVDDRDFVSTTRGSHTPKPLPHCQAGEWIKLPIETTKDGHVRPKFAEVGH